MFQTPAKLVLFALLPIPALFAANPDRALVTYKAGDYKTAIPLLQAAAADTPKDPLVRAALLSSLVYEGRVDEASDAADAAAAEFPNSSEVMAARGEFFFYMGDMPEAEKLFKAALKLKEDTPRAVYGLFRLFYMASLFRTSRLLCLNAHDLDPDDARITADWLRYLIPEKRKQLLGPFIAAHPWFYKNFERNLETTSEVRRELDERKIFELDGERKETTLRLIYLLDGPARVRGVGVLVAIQGGRPLRLLLDTGASGILLPQAAVDKAGLSHLGSFETRGIGDKGARNAFVTVADDCTIATLKYKTCVIRALEGKGRVVGDEDGLIGADVFSDYIVQIDFQKRTLHLTPQPDRPPNPQGYDRVFPPDESGFTPIFRYGHELLISTKVNEKSSGLFLLDTGAGISNIDSTFARLSTKIHGNDYMHVKGISGSVQNVFEADKAELQFGRFRQRNLGLVAFNLNNSPDHQQFRMAGILGVPILSMFRLTIDYRNGLVNFDYVLK